MMQLAEWLRLAVSGARPSMPDEARAAGRTFPPDEIARLAHYHGVAPWLSRAFDGTRMPAGSLEPLHAAARDQVVQTLALYRELTDLLEQLDAVDADTIVLKGAAFAHAYYPDPTLRPYRDIDLLIHEADLARIGRLLHARGYLEYNEATPRHHHHQGLFQHIFFHPSYPLRVELHVDHLQIGIQPVGIDELWARAPLADFAALRAHVLEAHDLFVLGCVHLHRHSFGRLIWFKDLDLMVRSGSLDWAIVLERAQEQACVTSVAYTLELLEEVLAVPLPTAARRIVDEPARVSRWVQRALWPKGDVLKLRPQRQWRLRRAMQFAPETGLLRGALPSLVLGGRRREKLQVLGGFATGRRKTR